jgi:hypothetical protein
MPLFLGTPAQAASFFSWVAGTNQRPASRPVPNEQGGNSTRPTARPTSTECQILSPGCGNTTLKVDVANNCMCVGDSCFKVASGYKTGDIGLRRGSGSAVTRRDVVNAQTHNTAPGGERLGVVGGVVNRRARNRCGNNRGPGCRYETLSPTPRGFNYDAMTMSARNTNSGGKWIHQIPGCGDYTFRTQGCIGVPCDKWSLVKTQMGKPMSICGGGAAGYTGPSVRRSTSNSGGQTRLQRRIGAAEASRNTNGTRGSQRAVH